MCCKDLPEKTPTSGILEDHGANVKGTPESDITYMDPSGLYVHKSLPAVRENFFAFLSSTRCFYSRPPQGCSGTCYQSPSLLNFQSGFNLSPLLVCQDVPESLSSHWDTICVTYVNNIKFVMQHLRSQRAEIDRRFYDMRYSFTAGLLHTSLV